MHWLRSENKAGLGICSFCDDAVDAWDQGARDVRTLAEIRMGDQREEDLAGWLISHARLPSLPHVLIEIYQELESETAGIERMIQLLETDPGLTARSLQLGNSAYYGSSRQVTRIADAILRVGPFDLWALLISTEVKSLFFGISPNLIDMNRFWRHSLFTACACRKLAEANRLTSPGDLFIAGLIHDIGKLLLLQQLPVEYAEIIDQHTFGDELCHLEESKLGINHALLGGRLLDSWSFPEKLVRLTANHHMAEDGDVERLLLRQSDQLANRHLSGGPEQDAGDDHPETLVTAITVLYNQLTELVL